MDEPTDGLDPNQKHHVRQLITDMAADKAIIISTHILEEVEAVCSRAVVINKGVIVADGTADDLMQRMHYHGAVSLKVVADRADAAIRALSNASTVARVETVRQTERIFAASGNSAAEDNVRRRSRSGIAGAEYSGR